MPISFGLASRSGENPVRLFRLSCSIRACRLGNKLTPRVTWNHLHFPRTILRLTSLPLEIGQAILFLCPSASIHHPKNGSCDAAR